MTGCSRKRHILFFLITVLHFFPITASAAALVLLDPGHGGKDLGGEVTGSLHEKDLTLEIAQDIENALKNNKNIRILLTRSEDRDVSLATRLQITEKEKPDLLISLHVNAGFDRKASGFEVYYPGFGGLAEPSGDGKAIAKDMVKNKVLNESNRFGHIVLKRLDPVFPRGNRNLRDAPMAIFKNPSTPAVLVEIGFATNPEDRKRLQDKNNPGMIAHALTSAIQEFFDGPGGKK